LPACIKNSPTITPSYKDLGHFLSNVLQELPKVKLATPPATEAFKREIQALIADINNIIATVVVAHAAGRNLARASGLSVYIPADTVHSSFATTDFGRNTSWCTMLRTYLQK
jgi:hypothetical protein